MDKLGPYVSVYRPSSTPSPKDPNLIIIASWTNAQDVHIAKYIAKYRSLYPDSQILLVKSVTKLLTNKKLIDAAVSPAVPVIRAADKDVGLLVHMFSNGGSSSIATLYDVYATTAANGQDTLLPVHVTLMDSVPGHVTVSGIVAFLRAGMSKMQRLIFTPLLYVLAVYSVLCIELGIYKDFMKGHRTAHNDKSRNQEVRRAYIYSETDELVQHKHLEAHASEAESKGYVVEKYKFDGTAHVAHVRGGEDRYWRIVTDTWAE